MLEADLREKYREKFNQRRLIKSELNQYMTQQPRGLPISLVNIPVGQRESYGSNIREVGKASIEPSIDPSDASYPNKNARGQAQKKMAQSSSNHSLYQQASQLSPQRVMKPS